jgi:5-methylcytosine-specific restriction endonuclease McrA
MRSVYKILNKERLNAKSRKLARLNKAKIAFKAAKKRACKLQATPKWLTEEHKKQISEFYELAHELAWLNEGEVFHVDHIIPLKGTNVCGLHVPWNLQLLPAHKNLKKSNKNLL